MNPALKLLAALLLIVAVVLGAFAWHLASKPAPPPPAVAVVEPVVPQKAPEPQITYPVVMTARNIVAGAPLTIEDFKTEQWPVSPSSSFANSDELVGKYLRFDLPAGEPVTQAMLMQGLSTYLKEGERAISIPVDEISGASNRVQPGDMVDVFFTMNRDSSGESGEIAHTQSRLLLPLLRVLAYGSASVDGPLPGIAEETGNNRTSSRDAKASSAMLAVPLERVNELLLAVRSGKLQLALRSPDDASLPNLALFPAHDPLLKGRKDLTPEQRSLLADADNRAYAGERLSEVSGSDTVTTRPITETAVRTSAPARPRSIEVIRAGKSQQVPY